MQPLENEVIELFGGDTFFPDDGDSVTMYLFRHREQVIHHPVLLIEGVVWKNAIRAEMTENGSPTKAVDEDEWVVEGRRRRAVWTTETTECANCGSTLELGTTYYYATLRSIQSTPTQTRELVLCSRNCFDEWR